MIHLHGLVFLAAVRAVGRPPLLRLLHQADNGTLLTQLVVDEIFCADVGLLGRLVNSARLGDGTKIIAEGENLGNGKKWINKIEVKLVNGIIERY